ncbi:MAG: DUF4199 domain-containing protein [Flavobacteriaceae bacterium]|nr:DUF4199 domain-containing protein [Flavobacteriaceae bacterium]
MENQQTPTKKIILNYGGILGIVSVLISVVIYALGMQYDQDWKTGSLGLIAMAVIIFLGIKKFREFNEDNLSIGEALKTGIGIALIGGIISVVYSFIFMNYIEPDFMTNTMAKAEIEMIENFPQLTDEQIEKQIEMMKNFSTPAITSAIALVASLFFGFIFALISGLILKKDENK